MSMGWESVPPPSATKMAQLKKAGYIIQPHTSAGSVPSDKGYRYYVETLSEVQLPVNQQLMISHLFHQVETRLEEWEALTANILAHLVQNMAVVATARANISTFKHVELVSLQDTTALIVLVLHNAKLRQELIRFDTAMQPVRTGGHSSKINIAMTGLTRQTNQGRKALSCRNWKDGIVETYRGHDGNEDTTNLKALASMGYSSFSTSRSLPIPVRRLTLLDMVEHKS